jgi:hypothetical protein
MATVYEEIKIGSKADTRGFKKAESAAHKLNKTLRNLGLALGTAALVNYGKAAVKAFAADEASAKRLATAVDNLGLSMSQSRVTDFIANLEKSSAIADDVLRPAFQALLTTTGSLTASQKLLNNAIQISRASGIELATVSQDLANGYVGITKGLKKYNTGLTAAELKSKSFNEVLGIMLAKSAGAADAYLTTTAYKLDVLTLASDNAKETIGKGLVDAFARIGGGTEASDAAKAIDNIAKATSNVIVVLGTAIGAIEKFRQGYTNFLAGGDVNALMAGAKPSTNRSKSPAGTYARTAQQRKAEEEAAKRAQELANLTKKQVAAQKSLTAEQKKQAALKKAGTVFDLEQIGIVAALKGQLSEDDKIRLQAQLALLNGNADLATKLTNQILMAQDSSGNLAKFLAALPNAKNPFEYLDAYLTYLASKAASVLTGTAYAEKVATGGGGNTTVIPPKLPDTNVPSMPSDGTISYNQSTGLTYNPNAGQPVINVTVQGNVIREQELINQVLAGAQLSSLSGSPSQIGRIAGMFS